MPAASKPTTRSGGSFRLRQSPKSLLLLLLAVLVIAAWALPATAAANAKELQNAKARFSTVWDKARNNYNPMAVTAKDLITACNAAAAIPNQNARNLAFAALKVPAAEATAIVRKWSQFAYPLFARNMEILDAAKGLKPPLWGVNVVHGSSVLDEAVDELLGGQLSAATELRSVHSKVVARNCSGAKGSLEDADDLFTLAIHKKVRAFKLLERP